MDRRSRKTRARLIEAMVALIHETPWEALSIQQICDRADIARSTFYLHFAGKDALLEHSLRHLGERIRATPRDRNLETDGVFGCLPPFLHMMTQPDHAFLFATQSASAVVPPTRSKIRRILEDLLADEIAATPRFATVPFMTVCFLAGGVMAAVVAWHEARIAQDLDDLIGQLDALASRLLTPEASG